MSCALLQAWRRRPNPPLPQPVSMVEHERRRASRLARCAVSRERGLLHEAFMSTVRSCWWRLTVAAVML